MRHARFMARIEIDDLWRRQEPLHQNGRFNGARASIVSTDNVPVDSRHLKLIEFRLNLMETSDDSNLAPHQTRDLVHFNEAARKSWGFHLVYLYAVNHVDSFNFNVINALLCRKLKITGLISIKFN